MDATRQVELSRPTVWVALRDGVADAVRIPAPLAIVFLATLLPALVLTIPAYAAMHSLIGHRLAGRDLALDFDGVTLFQTLVARAAEGQPGALPDGSAAPITLLGMPLILTAGALLPAVVLSGGILLTYVEGRFAWRRFVWGAWHWLLAFAALAILFILCSAVVLVLGSIVVAIAEALLAGLAVPALVLVGLVYLGVAMWFEYARVVAVTEGTRNIFRALAGAATFIAHRPAQTALLYLVMAAISLGLMVLYANVVAPVIPAAWAVVAIAAQQVLIAARLAARLARLAGEVALYSPGVGGEA